MKPVPFFNLGRLIKEESSDLHLALDRVIESGNFIGGSYVESFEKNFAEFVGTEQCIGVANGLDAIRLILEAYKIGPEDEVIVPAFTYYATWLAVVQTGAKLVPVDVIESTANLDPELVESAITSKTRAILVVHLFGQGADMKPILEIGRRRGILVFEDAAQSHGAETSSGLVGSSSDAAAFSFYPTKNLGALGDAGAVTTNDSQIASRIRSRRSYGQGSSKYEHIDTGWNSRLDPIQAEFLNIHLGKLTSWTSRRREIANKYIEALGFERAKFVIGNSSPRESVWHHFVLRSSKRELLKNFLLGEGVLTDVHYPYSIRGINVLQTHIAPTQSSKSFLRAEHLANSVLSIPMGPWLNDLEIEQVCKALSKIPIQCLD